MRSEVSRFLPAGGAGGEGDHPQGGGGVKGTGRASYPSTMLRMVPLPISAADGEET